MRKPPYFEGMDREPSEVTDLEGARVLLKLGDSVTTDHISPAGAIKEDSPAGRYLKENGIARKDFNSYGSRRGNHEVMIRGTFANIRLRNELRDGDGKELPQGGWTADFTRAATRRRCTTRRRTTPPRAPRWSCSRARSTARARRATGRPRARRCSACAP